MVDLREIVGSEHTALAVLHFIFVFMVSILLLNFLIAVFSDSVNIVNQNHDVVYNIQQLSVILTVERRVQWLFRKWYICMSKKCFDWEDNKVFLTIYQPVSRQ